MGMVRCAALRCAVLRCAMACCDALRCAVLRWGVPAPRLTACAALQHQAPRFDRLCCCAAVFCCTLRQAAVRSPARFVSSSAARGRGASAPARPFPPRHWLDPGRAACLPPYHTDRRHDVAQGHLPAAVHHARRGARPRGGGRRLRCVQGVLLIWGLLSWLPGGRWAAGWWATAAARLGSSSHWVWFAARAGNGPGGRRRPRCAAGAVTKGRCSAVPRLRCSRAAQPTGWGLPLSKLHPPCRHPPPLPQC